MRNALLIIGLIAVIIATVLFVNNKPSQSSEQAPPSSKQSDNIHKRNTDAKTTKPIDMARDEEILLQGIDDEISMEAQMNASISDDMLVAEITANMGLSDMQKFMQLRQNPKVRTSGGLLVQPYQEIKACEEAVSQNCEITIKNTSTGITVWDGKWLAHYIETGVGQEVVFVREK